MAQQDRLLRLVYRLAPHWPHRRAAEAALRHGSRVLDVGGGAGHLARALREKTAPSLYVLADPDQGLLEMAPRWPWVERVQSVGESLPLRTRSLDVAVFHDSLHHIPDPERALREAARTARCLVIDDIDPSTLLGRIIMLLEKLSGYPAKFQTPESLAETLRRLDLEPSIRRGGGLPASYLVEACHPG